MKEEKIGKKISEQEFDKMKAKYQARNPGKTKSVRFSKAAVQELLTANVEYLTVYLGEMEDGTTTVMLAGADKNMRLLSDDIMDRGQPCPPYC